MPLRLLYCFATPKYLRLTVKLDRQCERFRSAGLLPRLCRWKTCRSECSVKMAGEQAPITGRFWLAE